MTTLFLDLETYSATPIANGTHVYAADAEIMLFAYAVDENPVQVWDCTAQPTMPNDLSDALEDESVTLCAHNTHFDRTVLFHSGYHLDISRWGDTMVQAMAHSLPGSLGLLSEILKLKADEAKDKRGKELVQLFCKPRPKTFEIERATSATHPKEWQEFIDYAGRDIDAMRAIGKKLPNWNYKAAELALWRLDQKINQRGFMVDQDLARSAIHAVEVEQAKLAERTQELTGNAVQSATQRDAVLKFILEEHGVTLPDMKASTLERRMLDENLPPKLRELMAIRLQASTTSVSKYKALIKGVSSDSRLRGTLQFNGALRTGRYAGRLFQPQNLPRPTLGNEEIELGVSALKAGCADLCVEDVMQLASSAIRGCIIAPPNKKLVIADLSNIEGRILAWLVGEAWKLKAFADYDKGEGHDLYNLTYAKSFRVAPETVTKAQRQVGKVEELAFGYQGGVGACITFASAYNLDLETFAALIDEAPKNLVEESEGFLEWMYKQNPNKTESAVRYGLTTDAFIGCDVLKRMWREAHPQTAMWWSELEDAARQAIAEPTKAVQCRKVKMVRTGAWLRIVLPSGRTLCYPSPQVSESGQISYMGIDQYSRKWSRLTTYGGKLAENITQAVARDVLLYNMPDVEAAGYEVVLTVHDEIIAEAPDSPEYSAQGLAALMSANKPWAKGLPLAAAGFETYRYRKE